MLGNLVAVRHGVDEHWTPAPSGWLTRLLRAVFRRH